MVEYNTPGRVSSRPDRVPNENLLIGTLDIHSARLGADIVEQITALGPDASPLTRLRAVAGAFLPTDEVSTAAMRLYHGFAAVALTDASLRRAEAFRDAVNLVDFLATQLVLAQEHGELIDGIEPAIEARGILALVLGLSLGVLLEQMTADEAEAVLDAHFGRLSPTNRKRR